MGKKNYNFGIFLYLMVFSLSAIRSTPTPVLSLLSGQTLAIDPSLHSEDILEGSSLKNNG